jgi:hypothetical protein
MASYKIQTKDEKTSYNSEVNLGDNIDRLSADSQLAGIVGLNRSSCYSPQVAE